MSIKVLKPDFNQGGQIENKQVAMDLKFLKMYLAKKYQLLVKDKIFKYNISLFYIIFKKATPPSPLECKFKSQYIL